MKRRTLILGAGAGAAVAAAAGAGLLAFNAREARRAGAALKTLSPDQQETLEALGEALLPGAREAGIAHFVDAHLAAPPEESLLVLRYFDWPPPYAAFYAGGLAALEGVAEAAHGRRFAALAPAEAEAIVRGMFTGQVEGWKGPPAPLVYLAVRSDAVDVVYGTVEGFEKLGVPYMAHIEPKAPW